MKRISTAILAPVIVVVFFGGILLSVALNVWSTESEKVAAKYTSGDFRGTANPADIRGSYTLAEIEANFRVPVRVLAQAFGADTLPEPAEFKAKELENMFPPQADGGEIGTDSVRLFVARYLGLPYTPEGTTRLPAAAAELLREKLAPADFSEVRKIAVGLGQTGTKTETNSLPSEASAAAASGTKAAASEVHGTEDTGRTITGNTTFYDLLSWGVSRETISGVLGKPVGPTSQTLRNFCQGEGLSFSEMKAKLQTEVPAE